MPKILECSILSLRNLPRATIVIIILVAVKSAESIEDLKCTDTGSKCAVNSTCEFNCLYPCCNNLRSNVVVGSVIYSVESSVCRSALHDLRISLHNKTARNIKIQRFNINNCSLESSVRFGFSSFNFQNGTCDVLKFVSPHIKEDILDVTSMHLNYLYGENETHTQVCVTASNALDHKIKFGIYSEWTSCNKGREDKGMKYEAEIRYINIWSEDPSTAGFQCVPGRSDLSVVTSIAFQKNASFLPERLTIIASKYENVTLDMMEVEENFDLDVVWRKDSKTLNLNNETRTKLFLMSVHESASGIYSLGYKSFGTERLGFVQLIVRACPEGKFGDNCSMTCPDCLNGGICHDITGECLCAPGFNGSLCEEACLPGHIGRVCNIKCMGQSFNEGLCKGLSICLPHPYGCSCASGFYGLLCDKICPDGFYGARCLQRHKHVHRKEGTCSKFFNFCECVDGWHGASCNESYPVLNTEPSLTYITESTIGLTFNKWSNATDLGSGTPAWYEVVFKEMNEDVWRLGLSVPAKAEVLTYEVQVHGLRPATHYTVGVIVVDESENKRETGIKTMNVTTDCDVPSMPPFDIKLSSANQHIYVHWQIPPEDTWNCWDVNISVTAWELSTNLATECIKSDNFSCSFYSDPLDTWIVRVCASTNEIRTNCAQPHNITAEGSANTSPIELEIIKTETSVFISWVPNRFSSKLSHYVINYEDLDSRTSNSITVQTQDAICEGNKGNYNCYTIENLKQQHTYAIEIIAYLRNINEGTVINSFVVRLEKSADSHAAILGICLPLLLIFCITVFIIFLRRRKKVKSALKIKFLPYKIESEFASCNEALDEMDIIETESMCEEISNAIPVGGLLDYVKQNLQNAKIRKEFMSVPTGQIYPCNIAKLGENKPKNRYGNILPYDHSRVILEIISGDPFSHYIHASHIHGYNKVKKYIATQGPLANTVKDFWRMVWNEGCYKILMITNFVENGKCKCEKYWPETSCTYWDIEVHLKECKTYADYVIRTFDISKDDIKRELKHFHFIGWPDHGAPMNTTPFVLYLKKSRSYMPDSEAPIVIHCSAGIGRTGATILLDSMMDMGLQEKKVDLVNQLCSMRKQRMNIVENYDQYVFVYYALVEALCFEETCIKLSDFEKEFERLKNIDKMTGVTCIEKQFMELNSLNNEFMFKDLQGAYQMENQWKNKSMLILPPDRGRPCLSRNSSGYINAVFVDSTPRLWEPQNIQTFGEFEIVCESVITMKDMTVETLSLTTVEENNSESLPIKVLTLKNWAVNSNLPADTSGILEAIKEIHAMNSESKITATIVCSDGAMASGLFCASLYIYDQIKAEDEVDIFHAVKCIRTNRTQFISNLVQYEFLFHMVSSYSNIKEE